MRSYGDSCGIARALDLVGERWAMLVVRELLLGPKRFSDLLAGLPRASPNVLSQRLRELEDAGVLLRRKLEPPAAAWVYDLTPRGQELEPILLALGRWGAPLSSPRDSDLSVDALMVALKTVFDPQVIGRFRAQYEIIVDSERFRAEIARGHFKLERGAATGAAAFIDTNVPTLRSIVFEGLSLTRAERHGRLRIKGDREAAKRLFESLAS